jgi:hypothetical protein
MIEQLASLPGVRAVAQVSRVPLSPGRSQGTFRLPNYEQTHEFDVNTGPGVAESEAAAPADVLP